MAEFNNSREPFHNNVQEINTINIPETYQKKSPLVIERTYG